MNYTNFIAFTKSRAFVKILALIGFLIILIITFEAGIFVGFHKASFASDWENNYGRNFGPPEEMVGMMGGRDVPNPHGAVGIIVSVSLPTMVVAGPDEGEKTVTIGSTTLIRDGVRTASTSDLTIGASVVVIGEPNSAGQIEAQFIRLMPHSL